MNHNGKTALKMPLLPFVMVLFFSPIILGLTKPVWADFIPEQNPPGFDAPDPEQVPNFNCPQGYFFEGNHEYQNGPGRCTLMTCQNHSDLPGCLEENCSSKATQSMDESTAIVGRSDMIQSSTSENNANSGMEKPRGPDGANCDMPFVPEKTCNPPDSGTDVSTMHISNQVLPILEKLEGHNSLARAPAQHITNDPYGLYNDNHGFCTSGYGHLVIDNHPRGPCTIQDIQDYQNNFPNGQTQSDAENQLQIDMQDKEREMSNALGPGIELTQNQYDALMLISFNVGAQGALGKGHSLGDDIRAGNCNHTTITNDFRLYNHSGGHVDPTLTMRRESEAALFNFGIYPRSY
jgi:GH24 family phage-related lysozyme (muramidase)